MQDIATLISKQRQFFASGATLPLDFRLHQLKKLKALLLENEANLATALAKDLGKAPLETAISEVMLVIDEINFVIKKLKSWVKPQRVPTPFPALWPGRSSIHFEPYGCALIIAPWNYPLLLLLSPLIGAMGAGNCIILKPSEVASHTQQVLIDLLNNHFPAEFLIALHLDPSATETLLKEKFDYIFFTGSTHIGKKVMHAAAEHLTPVTLELGGKSPCIVDETADIPFAARRIIWGKMINAGQTCIAPDFLYVHQSCKDRLIHEMRKTLIAFYGNHPEKSPDYGRIINAYHFSRLKNYLAQSNIIVGGEVERETLFIAPTLLDQVDWHHPVMQEEIFGPILPILIYNHIAEVITVLKNRPKPLALYLFSKHCSTQKTVVQQLSFGGGCINDCVLQIANMHLPFGGVGLSGMGHYHGRFSFETFSHAKSIYQKLFKFDLKLEYPPYSQRKFQWLKRLIGI